MSEADAVAKLVQGAAEPMTMEVSSPDGEQVDVLLLPEGGGKFSVHSVKKWTDEYRDAPVRRRGTSVLTDLDSFVAHVKRFSDVDSAVFANRNVTCPSLTCVFDYHRQTHKGAPRFGEHRAHYAFPLSDEWTAWKSQNGKAMSQTDFSVFLEDRIVDVISDENVGEVARDFAQHLSLSFASPSRLLELSRGLSVRVGQNVRQHVNNGTGECVMSFDETHSTEQHGPLKVPGAFLIAIPVFKFGAAYQVPARLRYRVNGGQVSWHYELSRVEAVFDHAISEAVDRTKKDTGLPVFSGAPEA